MIIKIDATDAIAAVLERGHVVPTEGKKGIKCSYDQVNIALPGGHTLRGGLNLWISPGKNTDLARVLEAQVSGKPAQQAAAKDAPVEATITAGKGASK